MKKYLLLAVSLTFHLVAISLIIYLAMPIAKWYLEIVPARGVDLYLSASYVAQLLRHFSFRFNGWKEIWFSGVPYYRDYPSFYFYLMIPFAQYFGLIGGIKVFAVVGLFVFASFSYLLYHQLSKNRVLAIILTLATVFSANLYRALVWAGGIPFWTTQAFFPIVLFLVVKFCQSEDRKWLSLAALVAGLGIMGHPQNFLNFILPAAILILFFWQPAPPAGRPGEKKSSFKKRTFDVVTFGGLAYLVGLPLIVYWMPVTVTLGGLLNIFLAPLNKALPVSTGGAAIPSEVAIKIEEWTKSQFNFVFTDSHQLLWYLVVVVVAIFVLSLVFRKKRLRAIVSFVPFGITLGLAIGLVFLYSRGIDLYVTGWYKAFWPVLVSVATMVAFLWGEAKQVFVEGKFWQKKAIKVLIWLGAIVVNLILVSVGYYFLLPSSSATIKRIEEIDQFSSAYPETLNAKNSQEDLSELKDELKPKLMIDDPHDYRLYVIDATVNIWWGALEQMPLTRGYIDPPLTTPERWGIFWLDSALGPTTAGPKSSLIEDWNTPEEVADNNVYFLLDWYATKYLEGSHISATNSNFASNIMTDKFIEEKERIETQGGVVDRFSATERWDEKKIQFINFYRIKNELVSPILTATNAPVIMHLGDEEGYDTLTRYLGMMNLGSRNIILARGPRYIDDLSFSDLLKFDALILYKYDYHNHDKAWGLIDKYLERGGKIFIDTGDEVKESDLGKLPPSFPSELPGIFPMKRTVREGLGYGWEIKAEESVVTKDIDFSQFSSLIFEGEEWNISHPITDEDLREGAKVILRHKGLPVAIESEIEGGRVIWSGFNLPYHVIRDYNHEEGKFFKNLLSELVDLKGGEVNSKTNWISPRERIIEASGAKGVLFKEQAFPGWRASLGGGKTKIYKVGPSTPGFMYVRLPEGFSGQVEFKYLGPLDAKIYSVISLANILFIVDYLFGGRVLVALLKRLSAPVRKKAIKWWEREEEY